MGIPILQSRSDAASYFQVVPGTTISVGSAYLTFHVDCANQTHQGSDREADDVGPTVTSIKAQEYENETTRYKVTKPRSSPRGDEARSSTSRVQPFYDTPAINKDIEGSAHRDTNDGSADRELLTTVQPALRTQTAAPSDLKTSNLVNHENGDGDLGETIMPATREAHSFNSTTSSTEYSEVAATTLRTVLALDEVESLQGKDDTQNSNRRRADELLSLARSSLSPPSSPPIVPLLETVEIVNIDRQGLDDLNGGYTDDRKPSEDQENIHNSETDSEPPTKRTKRLKRPSRRVLEQCDENIAALQAARPRLSPAVPGTTIEDKHTSTNQARRRDSTVSSASTGSVIYLAPQAPPVRASKPARTYSRRSLPQPMLTSSGRPSSQLNSTSTTTTSDHRLSIFFTSSTEVDESIIMMRKLTKAGMRKVDSVADCDYICVGKDAELKKTSHLILAVSSGKAAITDDWARESAKGKKLLDPLKFLAGDPMREVQWGVTLTEAVERGKEGRKPLTGTTILFTTFMRNDLGSKNFEELKRIAMHGGARCVQARAPRPGDDKEATIILSSLKDPALDKWLRAGWRCYSKDLITMTVLRGEVDLYSAEFALGTVEEGGEVAEERDWKHKRGD